MPYLIAYKKVYSEKGIESQVRNGAQQLERHARLGFVAINLGDLAPARSLLQSQNQSSESDFLAQFNHGVIDRDQARLQRFVLDGWCDGVVVSTKTLADVIDSTPDSTAHPNDAVESGVDQRRTVRAAREGPNRARGHCMSKALMVGLCAERCPAEAATADHVIARGTPQSAARNLPKVGACKECKKKESHLVHRLASSVPFGARHARAAESLQAVDGKLAKSQKLLR